MNKTILMDFDVDKANKRINVKREFAAPREMVWAAWTQSELLDQWWAPKPYVNKTKSMDFREGGHWLYSMTSPEGEAHWCRADYEKIKTHENFSALDAFCDSEGKVNESFPRSHWSNSFSEKTEDSTQVSIQITYKKLEDLEMIVKMGFKEGFTAGLEQLDHYLATQMRLRKEYKRSHQPRVSTYLNFPGKTEEAFEFYKKVFRGEFTGGGLKRFGDFELPDAPPMSEADKKLIIHAELTVLGGHILMATDAPESMGFKMEYGNNMHINLEPDTREETERLFKELSEDGEIKMPLQDMFWGGYFGSFKDKYGINWMLNHTPVNES